jgi:hypothetical protein
MIYLWLLSAGLIGLACKEITWRQLGDLITFIVVFSVGLTLLVQWSLVVQLLKSCSDWVCSCPLYT